MSPTLRRLLENGSVEKYPGDRRFGDRAGLGPIGNFSPLNSVEVGKLKEGDSLSEGEHHA